MCTLSKHAHQIHFSVRKKKQKRKIYIKKRRKNDESSNQPFHSIQQNIDRIQKIYVLFFLRQIDSTWAVRSANVNISILYYRYGCEDKCNSIVEAGTEIKNFREYDIVTAEK